MLQMDIEMVLLMLEIFVDVCNGTTYYSVYFSSFIFIPNFFKSHKDQTFIAKILFIVRLYCSCQNGTKIIMLKTTMKMD